MKHTRLLSLLLAGSFAVAAGGGFKPPRNMPNETVIGYDGTSAVHVPRVYSA